jgi:hypothetical protein
VHGLSGRADSHVTGPDIPVCYVGPCHHGMARPRVADGGDGLQIWRVAANVLNKQSRLVEKGRSSSLGVGQRASNSSL